MFCEKGCSSTTKKEPFFFSWQYTKRQKQGKSQTCRVASKEDSLEEIPETQCRRQTTTQINKNRTKLHAANRKTNEPKTPHLSLKQKVHTWPMSNKQHNNQKSITRKTVNKYIYKSLAQTMKHNKYLSIKNKANKLKERKWCRSSTCCTAGKSAAQVRQQQR